MPAPKHSRSGRSPWLALALLALAGSSTARAAVLCVKPGGGSGCSSTIGGALVLAAAGDTIQVAAGTYVETLLIDKSVVVQGGWNDTFTIQDPTLFVTTVSRPATWNSSVVRIVSTAATFDGFTVTGGRADLGFNHGGGLRVTGGATAVVRRNRITGNTSYVYGGGVWVQSSTVRLEANRIENNTVTSSGSGGGAYLEVSQITVVSNVIANNTFDSGGRGGGIACDFCSGVLANNTFVSNAQQGISSYAGTLTLTNNVIKGHAVGVELLAPGTITSATFNDFFGNTTNTVGFTLDSTNLFVDPLLTTDFHLTAGSPMLDAGTRSTPADVDLDGEPRFMAGPSGFFRVDIGADEATGPAQIVVDVDTGGADFTLVGPGGSASETNGQNNWIGYSALASDVNGDGHADLVVAAEDWTIDRDNPPRAAGRLFGLPHFGSRVTGTVDLLTAPPSNLLTVLSTYNLQHVGAELVGGDVTGDGVRDLIAGSYEDDAASGGTVFSTVFVLEGGAALAGVYPLGPTAPARFTLKAPGQDFLAFSAANALAAGDVNGDGVADLVVGDALADHGATTDTGAVFVMFGGPGLTGLHDLATTPADLTIYGAASGDKLGALAIGRVNADSQADLVVRTDTTAYVFLGPLPGGTLTTAAANITITGLQAAFDRGQVLVGDLTGDGQDDLVLASGADLYLVPGPLVNGDVFNVTTRAVVTLTGAKARSLTLGDVAGDPRPDLIIGAPSLKQVVVIQGPIALTGTVPAADVAAKVVRSSVVSNLGWEATPGDLDGDGRPDLVVTSWQFDVASHPVNFQDAGTAYVVYSDRLTANLAITKTDGSATAVPGTAITYTIVASNAGPYAVTGATVTDTVPGAISGATWTCVGAGGGSCAAGGTGNINDGAVNLPVGATATYTLMGTISASATGTLSNTATVAVPAGVIDPNLSNNTATDTDTLVPTADLGITKTDGVTSVQPGTSTTYTIVASNPGPSNAPGSTVTDNFPAACTSVNWTCAGAGGGTCPASGSGNIGNTVNLPAAGSVTYSATCNVSPGATGNLVNTATVAPPASVTDPVAGNNSATDSDTLTPQADLAVSLADAVDPLIPGGTLDLTATLNNIGPSTSTGMALVINLPAGVTFVSSTPGSPTCVNSSGTVTCNLPGLAPAGSQIVTVNATVNTGTLGLLTTTATVTGNETDPVSGNNSDSETTTVNGLKGDFDVDGKTDILFQHTISGRNVVWFMDGVTRTAGVFTNPDRIADTNWRMVGTADFNSDQKTDILFRHTISGKNVVWYMDGITRTAGVFTNPDQLADTNWRIVGTGDFSLPLDGKPDLLYRHAVSGKNVVWYMDGITRTAGVFTNPDVLPDTNWQMVGIGDFSSPQDGKADILWRHAVSGKNVVWYMDGITRTGGVFTNPDVLPDTNWMMSAVGDYSLPPDGKPDILFRHAVSGKNVVWYMDGITRTSGVFTNPDVLPDTNWKIVGPR